MPVSPSIAAEQAKTLLQQNGFTMNADNSAFVDIICEAILNYIVSPTSGIVVNTTVAVTTPAGPGVGTGVGTLS